VVIPGRDQGHRRGGYLRVHDRLERVLFRSVLTNARTRTLRRTCRVRHPESGLLENQIMARRLPSRAIVVGFLCSSASGGGHDGRLGHVTGLGHPFNSAANEKPPARTPPPPRRRPERAGPEGRGPRAAGRDCRGAHGRNRVRGAGVSCHPAAPCGTRRGGAHRRDPGRWSRQSQQDDPGENPCTSAEAGGSWGDLKTGGGAGTCTWANNRRKTGGHAAHGVVPGAAARHLLIRYVDPGVICGNTALLPPGRIS